MLAACFYTFSHDSYSCGRGGPASPGLWVAPSQWVRVGVSIATLIRMYLREAQVAPSTDFKELRDKQCV